MKIKINNIWPFIIATFPIWNLINIIFMGDGFTFYCWRIFTFLFILHINIKGNKQKVLILDVLIAFNAIYLLLNGRGYYYWFNNDVYLFWLFLANIFYWDTKKIKILKEYIIENKKIAIFNAYFTTVTSVLSIFLGVGFVHAQGTVVFTGFFSLEHMLAYHILVTYMLLLVVEENEQDNRHIILKLILSIFLLLTAVRSAVIVLTLLLIYDFFQVGKKEKILISLCTIIILGILLNSKIINTLPLLTKTQAAVLNGDATNGRTVLSAIGYRYYLKNTNIIQKLFGIGIDNIRQKVYWNNLHAHNDFINILLGYGGVYVSIVIVGLINFCKAKRGILAFLIIAILAYFNGFYMYTEAVVALPIIRIAFDF